MTRRISSDGRHYLYFNLTTAAISADHAIRRDTASGSSYPLSYPVPGGLGDGTKLFCEKRPCLESVSNGSGGRRYPLCEEQRLDSTAFSLHGRYQCVYKSVSEKPVRAEIPIRCVDLPNRCFLFVYSRDGCGDDLYPMRRGYTAEAGVYRFFLPFGLKFHGNPPLGLDEQGLSCYTVLVLKRHGAFLRGKFILAPAAGWGH